MSTSSMVIVCVMLAVWSILVGAFLYYKKRAFDCQTNPAIKCWNDWRCWNDPLSVNGTGTNPVLTNGGHTDPNSVQPDIPGGTIADETSPPVASGSNGQIILNPGMLTFYGLLPSATYPTDPSAVKDLRVNAAATSPSTTDPTKCIPPQSTSVNTWTPTNGCCQYSSSGVCAVPSTGGTCTSDSCFTQAHA